MSAGTVITRDVYVGEDFYVPSFRLRVRSQDLLEEMNDVVSVSYSDSLANIDSFEMTVNNWDAERLRFKYSDGDTFNPWTDVELSMGYYKNGQDQRRRMLIGEITTLAPNFPSSGGPTLTVRGLNLLHRFRTKQETKPFFDKRDTEIARELVAKIAEDVRKRVPQIRLQLDPADIERNLNGENREQPIRYLVMNNQFPIVFLLERARRIGYELTMEEAPKGRERLVTLHFRPTSAVKQPTYVLEWGKSLISFQPTLQTANQAAEVTVRGWDPQTKREIKETATRADLVRERVIDPTSDLAVTEPSLAQKVEIIPDVPVPDKEAAKRAAVAALRQIAQDMVVAKGKTIGLPDLRSGVKVIIKGLGKRFSGPENQPFSYLVTETTHTMGDGGYTTDFTARMERS